MSSDLLSPSSPSEPHLAMPEPVRRPRVWPAVVLTRALLGIVLRRAYARIVDVRQLSNSSGCVRCRLVAVPGLGGSPMGLVTWPSARWRWQGSS